MNPQSVPVGELLAFSHSSLPSGYEKKPDAHPKLDPHIPLM